MTKASPHSFPRPLLRAENAVSVLPNPKSPENCFCKTESELRPRHLPEYLECRTPKKNVLSFLEEKIGRTQIRKARNIFLWGCRTEQGSGGAFVERRIQFRATTRSARAIVIITNF